MSDNTGHEYSDTGSEDQGFLDVPLNEELLGGGLSTLFGLRFSSAALIPEFATKLAQVIKTCSDKGVVMVPYTGVRDPWEQARLWRQSRNASAVAQAITDLKNKGAPFLAKVLDEVGPQPDGPNVTNALPGFSWHQHGEAADCYWQVNGKPEWNDLEGYKVYAEVAEQLGLTAGGYWTSPVDWPHVQYRKQKSPAGVYTAAELDTMMQEKFGGATVLQVNLTA